MLYSVKILVSHTPLFQIESILSSSTLSEVFVGYEVTGYTDGSVITSGYVYLDVTSQNAAQQVQDVLVDSAALYQNYGLNIDTSLIVVSGL